ncbi:hypothetical protein BC826DRAFT_1075635 [Russula brevipes]|nr:hypothetical protein BC826DRAFT_1075635 [Russula brevipes]
MLWDCLTLGLVMSLPLCCLSSLWPSQCAPPTHPCMPSLRLHGLPPYAFYPYSHTGMYFTSCPFPKFALWTSYSHGFQVHMALSVW